MLLDVPAAFDNIRHFLLPEIVCRFALKNTFHWFSSYFSFHSIVSCADLGTPPVAVNVEHPVTQYKTAFFSVFTHFLAGVNPGF